MNYENRDSFIIVMRLAFEAGAKGATFNGVPGVEDEPREFNDWIIKMKSKARLLRLRH